MNLEPLKPASRDAGVPAALRGPLGRSCLRVLIVEDDVEAARHMAEDLTGFGLETAVAHDGLDALEMVLAGELFDVLIIDRMLPGCDGLTLLRRLRDGGVEPPSLFVTAMGSVMDRVEGLQSGGDDYVVKPV